MLSHTLQDALASSTKVFGRSAVNVVFAGSGAHTDGTTVYMPAFPSNAQVSNEEADVARGYRSHEAGHVRFTNTSPVMNAKLMAAKQRGGALKDIINICEDIRIERASVHEYPGMRRDFGSVMSRAGRVFMRQVEEIAASNNTTVDKVICGMSPENQVTLGLAAFGRELIGVPVGEYAEAVKHMRPDIADLCRRMAKKMAALPIGEDKKGNITSGRSKKFTIKSFELGEEINAELKKLMANQPPPPPPPPQPGTPEDGDGQGQADGNDGEGEGGGADSSEADGEGGDDSASGDGEGSDGDGDDNDEGEGDEGGGDAEGGGAGSGDADADGDADGDRQGSGDGGGDGEQSPPHEAGSSESGGGSGGFSNDLKMVDQSEALKDMMDEVMGRANQASSEQGGPCAWRPVSPAPVRVTGDEIITEFKLSADRLRKEFERLKAGISGKQAMIRRILEQELEATKDRRWQGGFTSGRLSGSRLVAAATGRERVYRQREDGKDMDTLLQIHVDSSGSMGGGKCSLSWVATQLALALSEALERTGCEIIVTSWCSLSSAQLAAAMRASKDKSFTSYGAPYIVTYKSASQRLTAHGTAERFAAMSQNMTNGGTPLVDSVIAAVSDLSLARHGRRILLVLTDGDPDRILNDFAFDNERTISAAMKGIHDTCRREGIQLIGVGIGARVGHLFSDYVQTRGPDTFEAVVRAVARHLKQEKTNAFKPAA